MKIKNYIYAFSFLFLTTGCNDNFLDRLPIDQLSTTGSLATANELRLYMNQFYEKLPNHPAFTGGEGIAYDDARTDNMIFTTVNPRLNGQLTVSNAQALNEYRDIRGLNFFLNKASGVKGNQSDIDQYRGEAYFFRAWFYFELVKKYGDVSWVNSLLSSDDESTLLARDSRVVIIDSVLNDLQKATTLLGTKANSSSMRVHKDVAYAMISRVALYEGTWQKYHKAKNTGFATSTVTDAKIKEYLTAAKEAAQVVINSNRWSISTSGSALTDYRDLFNTADLSTNREVLMWRKYNPAENIGHGVSKYLSTGGGDIGVTLSLVDDYLTRDGRPFAGAERKSVQGTYGQELLPTIRDPRLSQTVGMPGEPIRPGGTVAAFPPINQSGMNRNTTGYPMYKYIEYNNMAATLDDGMSAAPVIYFRYAEILLNYAEAVAELGEDSQQVIEALRPLRQRVGMPDVNFDREFNANADYAFNDLGKVIQAVRRERRVEMVAEGTRLADIFRWAAADKLIVGKRPLGALFVGSNLDTENSPTGFYNSSLLYFDTAPAGKSVNFYLTGNAGTTLRYIDPYKAILPNGFGFKVNRDYLLPIQQRMIELTDGKWQQNPNW
ncbi:MAG TPA: RagB/SusD family nutrient uptake outer membrane protein [Sphingobacterium bovisgrunnientis]|nr:RagB/SusD family nutrient uptake outer membrane protein [Sphingobacterium bovisgrunnientis]